MGRSMDIAMKIGSMYWIRAVQGLDCNRVRTPEVLSNFSLFDPSHGVFFQYRVVILCAVQGLSKINWDNRFAVSRRLRMTMTMSTNPKTKSPTWESMLGGFV